MSAQTVQRQRSSYFLTPGLILGLILGSSLALFGGSAACGGEPDPSGANYGALLEYVVPERFISEAIWQMAPASCGGVLSDDMIRIGHAAGAPALGVVLDEAGRAICVDTWDAIHIELNRIKGDPSPDPMLPIELPGGDD